ncbi:hypothetical protein KTH44_09665 [Acinetobacter bereziniae]|uniref:hypothetical protein n=1 Tax=Acinetobacter bereziniae TaxID=106648 RepID=UPI0021CD41E2|nr:hypothetical protein [Acinetobacter bereziniae]MCU4319394.1 hypothetical protein [Acinetobacter bereziniae]
MKYAVGALIIIVLLVGYFINKSNKDDVERLRQAEIAQKERLNQNKIDEENTQKRIEAERVRVESEKALKIEQDKINSKKAYEEFEKSELNEKLKKIKNIEEKVKSIAFDPSSAQFRNQNGNCGEVNAKNKFGGYTGFKRYIYNPETDFITLEDSDKFYNSSMMGILWDAQCPKGQ